MDLLPALAITLVYETLLGLVVFLLVYRPLLQAAPLTKVCTSVGVTLAFQAIAVLNFGTAKRAADRVPSSHPIRMGKIAFPSARIYLAAIVVGVAVFLAVVYKFTRFGLATRAGAENPPGRPLPRIGRPCRLVQPGRTRRTSFSPPLR